MGHLSIATVVVFRNAGPLFTAVGENILRGEHFSNNSLVALLMMIIGGLVYGMYDLQFDSIGYMWAAFNLVCNTAAGLFGKHLSMDLKTEQSGFGLACYQNIVSIPMFLTVALATSETQRWSEFGNQSNKTEIPMMVIVAGLASCLACVTMGVSTFELQRLVSQATVAVANVSYKLVTLIVGALIFGNNVGMMGFFGLCIAQASAVLYVYERQYGAKLPSNASKAETVEEGNGTAQHDEAVALVKRSPTLKPAESKEEV
jgi:drug/metabolite transporter (DMT)-like permease